MNGLYKRIKGPDQAPEPAAPQREGGPGTPVDEIELEKRWLQFVRVDTDQFKVFYDKYHDHLFRYLELIAGDEETAQDLTQEVFVYAIDHLDRFTWQGRSFGAWLFHIARRRVLPRHWRAGRRRSEVVFLRERQGDRGDVDAAARLERTELLARVRSLVARFPDDRHDVFVLHVYMEFSQRATALALGMPEATVRSHLMRGRQQLAEWLREEHALSEAERRQMSALLAEGRGIGSLPQPRRQPAERMPAEDTGDGGHRRGGDDGHDA